MHFSLTEEQRLIVDTTRGFVANELYPHEAEIESTGRLRPELRDEIKRKAIDAGLYAANMPAEVGGAGLDTLTWILYERELGRANYALHWTCVARPSNILMACEGEQRERYLLPAVRGERSDCLAMTEPGAGSDLRGMKTRARRDGDDFIINGSKMWVTNGDRASVIALLVKTDPTADPRYKGMTALLVDKLPQVADQGGMKVSPPLGKLGYHGVESVEISFEDYRVPASAVLGGEDKIGTGFLQMMSGIETGRINVASRGLGISLRALELSLEYVQQREAFGKPIGHHQLIQKKLAEMATRIEASKHLILAAAKKKDSGQRADIEAGMAKLYATESCQRCAEEAMRIFGGYGYSTEYEVERLYRDAPLMMIGEGSNEIQETIIAKGLLKRYELI